jgi:hypothetical protein
MCGISSFRLINLSLGKVWVCRILEERLEHSVYNFRLARMVVD